MDFLSRLLSRPAHHQPAICDVSIIDRESVGSSSSPSSSSSSLSPAVKKQNRAQATDQSEQLTRISRDHPEASSSGPSSLVPESLSSASSFQSLASNHSSKSSSGICTDSAPGSPDKTSHAFDNSYINVDIPDVDDLINACLNINLNDGPSVDSPDNNTSNLSHDQTFASATDDTIANETPIELRLEESIQTFETCPVLETNQVLKAEPLSSSIVKSSASIDQPFITPYVSSFENSVVQRHDNESEFKSSLSSLQIDGGTTGSTLSSVVDVIGEPKICTKNETVIEVTNDIANFSLRDPTNDQKEQQNATEVNLCINNAQNYQTLDCTTLLSSESRSDESKKFIVKTADEFNSSAVIDKKSIRTDTNTTNKNELIEKEENTINNTDNKPNNQLIDEQIEHINSISKAVLDTQERENKVSIAETVSPKNNDTCVVNEIKTPNKSNVVIKKEIESSNFSETILLEESHKADTLNIEVIASTPLPTKSLTKDNTHESSCRKSALFVKKSDILEDEYEKECIKNLETLVKREEVVENHGNINFDETVAINKSFEKLFSPELIPKENLDLSNNILHENSLNLLPPQESEYEAFKPQQQSTNLPFPDPSNFRALQEAALSVAKEIDDSVEKIEESEHFVSATTELFGDPSALDYLNQVGSQTTRRGERYDSLYMKFDPLAEKLSMLPQKNLPASALLDEEKEAKVENSLSNMGTPKKNPALAAIDRLLFYSPCTAPSTDTEVPEAIQKKEVIEKQEPLVPIVDEKMAKELEFVRSTVLQLEAEIEKQQQEYKDQLDRQKEVFEDKISLIQTKHNQMQAQLTQEVKCKDQMTVVVEEYEKSISRLIAEREKDRTNFEAEKIKIQEELQVANQHLSNTEAAFSDVHSKYERLKNVVSAYKSNETVLKESIAENQETIKTLENRYEQLKSHAMAQLEKANLELSAIRKHNEAETVKLKALVRKAELKSKSLEETVEQKMKENKELTQIIDEMIARVD
ncbi:PREDICTED: probable myosin light chain kinase DDB_G0279831 [Ceratosolen solmsi marchali]|uniref:Probable myosin light chain kinase DDB_G0279831 n=1 Tax=Ceratosolen solmsi marchali TaxID=326594 RepID=A0AAJ7DU75_9HYME|nr:PREDICTED: probable myosin light chain kinase DDB_G0279831 [Ceratosolen solmsi marchali]